MGRPTQNLYKYKIAMEYLIKNDCTIKKAADKFQLQSSNLSKYLSDNLPSEIKEKRNESKLTLEQCKERNNKAIEYILKNECSQHEAADMFNMHYSALNNHIRRNCSNEVKQKLKEISKNVRAESIRNRNPYNLSKNIKATRINDKVKSTVLNNFKEHTKVRNIDILDFLLKEGIEVPVERFINILSEQGKKIVRC